MDEIESKLARCFDAVFPALGGENIPSATQENLAEWDSLASLTLLGVINEEFGPALDYEDLDSFTSFGSICEILSRRTPEARSSGLPTLSAWRESTGPS